MSIHSVNLVPSPRRFAAAARKRAHRWCWGVAIYAAVLLSAYIACSAAISVDGDDKTPMIEKATHQIEELNIAASTLRPQLDEAHTRLAVARTVGDQPDWSLLLAVVSSTVDDQIVLTTTKLEAAADSVPASKPPTRLPSGAPADSNAMPPQPTMLRVTLQGMGRSPAAVTQFVLRLERLGLFERVDLARSARQNLGAIDANVFRIECLLQRAGKPAAAPQSGGRGK